MFHHTSKFWMIVPNFLLPKYRNADRNNQDVRKIYDRLQIIHQPLLASILVRLNSKIFVEIYTKDRMKYLMKFISQKLHETNDNGALILKRFVSTQIIQSTIALKYWRYFLTICNYIFQFVKLTVLPSNCLCNLDLKHRHRCTCFCFCFLMTTLIRMIQFAFEKWIWEKKDRILMKEYAHGNLWNLIMNIFWTIYDEFSEFWRITSLDITVNKSIIFFN